MFRLVSGSFSMSGIEAYVALNTIFNLETLHVVPSCRFVQHEFLNLDVIEDSNRFLPPSSVNNS